MTRKVSPADFDNAVQRYLSGEQTQGEAAASIGIAQAAFSSRMIRNGYPRLSRSESMRRRLSALGADGRAALAASAQAARRGMIDSEEVVASRAVGRQRTLSLATDEERAIATLLPGAVLQQAVGRYNIDVAVHPVAVELFGGAWHAHGDHAERLPKRMRYLADGGWNVLIAWTHAVHPLDTGAVAQDALTYLERTRRDPTFRRQYRVVWGDGQLIAAGGVDDDKVTLIPAGIRGTYARRR